MDIGPGIPDGDGARIRDLQYNASKGVYAGNGEGNQAVGSLPESSAAMTSERLRRIVRARWWVLALAGLLSALAAVFFTSLRNEAIPEYEASIAVTYNRLLGEVDDTAVQERLTLAEELAVSVNASDLATGVNPLFPGARAEVIRRDTDLQLLFIGRGDTEGTAEAVATRMRDRYLAVQSLDVSQEFAERIADTADRLDAVIAEIALAAEPPDVADLENSARISELQAEVESYAGLYGQFTAELIDPRVPGRSREVILADRAAASEALRNAHNELINLEFALGQSTSDNEVRLAILRAEETQLRTALESYLGLSIVDEPIAEVGAVELDLAGIPPVPLPLAAVMGLLVGLLIGMAGLVIVDRVRQPVWEPTELEPRYRLPEVAARPRSRGDSKTPWYDTAPEGLRKAGIQQLRSQIEGMPGFGEGLVVGVAALNQPSPHVHELAADLAAGLASSGSWALLIDADYGQPSDLPEYRRSGLDLEKVVAGPATIGVAAGGAERKRDFLGVFISERSNDSADFLAQPAFAQMLDEAQALNDVVIVACPATDSASFHVLTQRLDAMILVSESGVPRPENVTNTLRALEERRSTPAGVVLIRPRVGPVSLVMNQIDPPPPTPGPERIRPGEWHWSNQQAADRAAGSVVAEPEEPLASVGVASVESDLNADLGDQHNRGRIVAPSAFSQEAHPSDHAVGEPVAATTDPDGAEVARGRIRRRALAKRGTQEPEGSELDVAGADGSPWTFRQD